ncbi:MAG: RidA family protein [Acidimicrobiia bacterium]
MTVSHQFLNPEGLARPVGFSHVALASPGRLVFLAGQTAEQPDGTISGKTIEEQFAVAALGLATALAAAGAGAHHLVWLQIFTTNLDGYRGALRPIGEGWKRAFGSHYPPTALFGISRLFHPEAEVELMGIAVVPD